MMFLLVYCVVGFRRLRRRLQAPFVVAEIMLAEMLEGNQTALSQLVKEIPFVLFGFLGTGKAAF